MYDNLLLVRKSGFEARAVTELCAILDAGDLPISTRAIIADALTSGGDPRTLAQVAGSARSLQRELDLSLSAARPPLEAVCLIAASLVRIHHAAGIALGNGDGATNPSNNRHSDSTLRHDLKLARQTLLDRADELAQTRAFGRRTIGAVVAMLSVVFAAALSALLFRPAVDVSTKLSIALPSLVVFAAIISYVGARAADVEAEPRWLAAVRDIWRSGRGD